jgi:hypothetical protein
MTTSSGGEDAGTAPALSPQVIHVAGGGATPAAAGMAAADAETTTKLGGWAAVTYVYDGTPPPDLTSPAGSWFFSPNEQPSQESIAAIAQALGVSGDVVQLPADQGGGWLVGPNDYSAPTLSVGSDAMHSWYYNAPMSPNVAVSSAGCAKPDITIEPPADRAGQATSADCEYVEPQPPAGILSAAEAEARARALFESLGIDLSSYDIEPYADDWSASVTATLLLEGIRTNVTISAGYGAEGALTWVTGFLETPQRSADYDRIGVPAALERLNDQNSVWMGYGGVIMDSARSGMAVGTAAPAPAPEPAVVPAVEPSTAIEPMPCAADTDCGSIPPPEPITITLTNARPSLEQLWAEDGTVWLLPGYAFDSTDGGIYTVIAVPDEYIEVTPPPEEPTTTAVADSSVIPTTVPPEQPDVPVTDPAVIAPPTAPVDAPASGDPALTTTPTS